VIPFQNTLVAEKEKQDINILLAEDDSNLGFVVQDNLKSNGYRVTLCPDGEIALRTFANEHFDLCILDVMMPGESGFDLTDAVRAASNVPIMLLTARGLPEDRIEGLERGADDYLSKPFEPRELLLRVGALLRRTRSTALNRQELKFGRCIFSLGRSELRCDDQLVKLTSGEAALLKALAQKPGVAISRQTLAVQTSTTMERSIDVQVTRLRKKIEEDPRAPIYLQTVRGVGYVLMAD